MAKRITTRKPTIHPVSDFNYNPFLDNHEDVSLLFPPVAGAANGFLEFVTNPAADETIIINGTTFTFKASGATGNQVNIGVDRDATGVAVKTALNASGVGAVAAATYDYSATTHKLSIIHDTPGVAGNAFTLVGDGIKILRSAATLQNGVDANAAHANILKPFIV